MSNPAKPLAARPAWRRMWKPAAMAGAGGTVIAVWLDEILLYADEIIGLVLLPIMAGVIYLLDILMFRSRMPRQEPPEPSKNKGANR